MKRVLGVALLAGFILTCLSVGHAAEPTDNATYFTRVGFFYESGVHKTVNYLRGFRVPVNTEVKILKKKKTSITIRIVDTDEKVKIENEKDYSGEDIDGIFARMFSESVTDLTAYPPERVKNIMAGTFEPGMTKDEIILSIGYPPKHRTPSLDQNAWRYWQSKFDTVLIYFKDDVMEYFVD